MVPAARGHCRAANRAATKEVCPARQRIAGMGQNERGKGGVAWGTAPFFDGGDGKVATMGREGGRQSSQQPSSSPQPSSPGHSPHVAVGNGGGGQRKAIVVMRYVVDSSKHSCKRTRLGLLVEIRHEL